jgi:predicted Zn-dependent protease with MMP-like domain
MTTPRLERVRHLRSLARERRVRRDRFEALVGEALDGLPPQYRDRIDNVAIVVEPRPAPELLARMGLRAGDTLLGLYQGVPLSARGTGYTMVPPDRITIFREPILSRCGSDAQVVREVRTTVLHELGHYFGLPEHELR